VDRDDSPPASISRQGDVVKPAAPTAPTVSEEISVEVLPDDAVVDLPEAEAEVVVEVPADAPSPGKKPAAVGADSAEGETTDGPVPTTVTPPEDVNEADIRTVEIEAEDEDEEPEELLEVATDASEAKTDSGPVVPLPVPAKPKAQEVEVHPDELLEVPDDPPAADASKPNTDIQLSPDDFIPAEQLAVGGAVKTRLSGEGKAVPATPSPDAPAAAEEELLELDPADAGAAAAAPASADADPDKTTVAKPLRPVTPPTESDTASVTITADALEPVRPTSAPAPTPEPAPSLAPAAAAPAPAVSVVVSPASKPEPEPDSVEDVLEELWAAKSEHAAAVAAAAAGGTAVAAAPAKSGLFAPADPLPAAGPARLELHCKELLAEVEGSLAVGIICLKSGLLLASRLAEEYPGELVDLPAAGFVELFRDRIFRRIDDALRRHGGDGSGAAEEVLFTGSATCQFVRKFPRHESAMVLVTRRSESAAGGWKSLRSAMERAQADLPS
jgi:hypothetical protein